MRPHGRCPSRGFKVLDVLPEGAHRVWDGMEMGCKSVQRHSGVSLSCCFSNNIMIGKDMCDRRNNMKRALMPRGRCSSCGLKVIDVIAEAAPLYVVFIYN